MSDYLARVPATVVVHAQQCLTNPAEAVRAAYLTGTVIGMAEGKQVMLSELAPYAQVYANNALKAVEPAPMKWVDYPAPPITNAELQAKYPNVRSRRYA